MAEKHRRRGTGSRRAAEDLTREVLPEAETRNAAPRSALYKPAFARVERMVIARRVMGIALVCCIVAVAVCAVFMWGIPAVQRRLAPAPSASPEASAEPESSAVLLLYDEATGIPLYEDDFNLFVVNAKRPAASDYAPPLSECAGIEVHERLVPALTALLEAAERAGYPLELSAGYVSYAAQSALYDRQVAQLVEAGDTKVMAAQNAKQTVPAPGESDLQSGMCVTLAGESEAFAETDVYAWLHSNMAAYGFVLRYPESKARYTGNAGSSLVLRYVGPENAAAMRRLSMCLEEYLSYAGV